ncbi:hypothetical protein [Algoriphagus winogradskyi]|uniref:Uncharacterized protein n=1 Tax=Algoriphagus winogradskyi TaxID=237017 RepID=A0ABY1PLP5_9BACT|nr:hypothetical protein [Algoriphagus winogradskyi]SMP35816.1 hypothetical protein SAMN06265367_11160 [Algoriphagus winogradskyi]
MASQNTFHQVFNDFFKVKLDDFLRKNRNASPDAANNFIMDEISKAKAAIQNLPTGGKINNATWD